jgi:hypothetical protein
MKLIKNKMSGTRNSHINYRAFWIRDNKPNRRKVDRFYTDSLSVIGHNISINEEPLEGLRFMSDNLTLIPSLYCDATNTSFINHTELANYFKDNLTAELTKVISDEISKITGTKQQRIDATRRLFRLLAFTYSTWGKASEFEQFRISTANKALSLAQSGMTEAFLVFSKLYPKLCTSQIQPYVIYDSLIYNDEHWELVISDPVYTDDMIYNVYFLSGFNPLWKEELEVAKKNPSEWDMQKWDSNFCKRIRRFYTNYKIDNNLTLTETEEPVQSNTEYDYSYLNPSWSASEVKNQEQSCCYESPNPSDWGLPQSSDWGSPTDDDWGANPQSDWVTPTNDWGHYCGERISDSSWTRNALIRNLKGRVSSDVLNSSSDNELLGIYTDLESWELA